LIGETTLRLDLILVPGGGTDDGWRGLKCKEKYAGEILVELTFWDLRPKDKITVSKRPKQISGFEETKLEAIPRTLGGAREMTTRQNTTAVKRRPLPANPLPARSGSGEERKERKEREGRRATRKSRHSYHPDSRPIIHQNSHSEPPQPPQPPVQHSRRRENRNSSSRAHGVLSQRNSMVFDYSPHDAAGRPEIYDPGDFHPNMSMERLGNFDEDLRRSEFPPPPPPAHRLLHMQHSISGGQPELPPLPEYQRQLRHFQSVPAFQQKSLNHRHSFDPRDFQKIEQFHQLQEFEPSYPDHSLIYQPSPHHAHNVYDSTPHEEELPPLVQLPSSASSNGSPRDGAPPPPPPPPPHRQLIPVSSPLIDEPNWDNLQPKSLAEEHGLPSYGSLQVAEKPSYGVTVNPGSIPLPASLIPGIDPVASSGFKDGRRPLQIEGPPLHPRTGTNYHRPQVEDVQDMQLYQPPEELSQRPNTIKKKHYSPPMVKPMPIHGERDSAVPVVFPSKSSIRKHSVLNLKPERKPVPPHRSLPPGPPTTLGGMPFNPDSYDAINPNPAASLEALAKSAKPEKMIMPGSNKVYDPTDVLLPETFAPEPEPRRRAPRPPPPVPIQHRRERIEPRSVSPVPPRGPRLSLPAPPPKQVSFESPDVSKKDRGKLRKSVRASQSMAVLPRERQESTRNRYSMIESSSLPSSPGGMVLFNPNSERERERQRDRERDARALMLTQYQQGHNNYTYTNRPRSSGMEVGYYGRDHTSAGASNSGPPPLPAKIPIPSNNGHGGGNVDEALALSQELSLISIGAGNGGARSRRSRF
jgi:hypothetical protein